MTTIAPFSGGPSSTVAIGGGISGTSTGGGAPSPITVFNAKTLGMAVDGSPAVNTLNGIITNLIAGAKAVLYIPPNAIVGLDQNFTLPFNVKLWMDEGATFKALNAGLTITFIGRCFQIPDWKIFDETLFALTVVFDPRSVDYVRPEWWGAIVDGVTAEDGALLKASTAASLGGARNKVKCRGGTWYVPNVVPIKHNVQIVCDGWDTTIFKRSVAGNAIFSFSVANYQQLRDARFDGNGVAGAFLQFLDSNALYVQLRRLWFTNFPLTQVAVTFVADAGNDGIYDELKFEPTGSQATIPCISFGADVGPNSRRFDNCTAFNGNPLFDFGGAELMYIRDCACQILIFSSGACKKILLQGCRVANQIVQVIKGVNHSIVGTVFGINDVQLDATTQTCTFDSNVVTNVADLGQNNKIGLVELPPNPITYSASMTPDLGKGGSQQIDANNATAFTINAPINQPITGGKSLWITIRNVSAGALGAATWNAIFKMRAWVQPAAGFSRSIGFRWNGTNYVELTRSEADIAN